MPPANAAPLRTCPRCGKVVRSSSVWRTSAVHCSTFCAARPLADVDDALERAIVFFVCRQGTAVTLRHIAVHVGRVAWRELMQDARDAAGRLAAADRVTIGVSRRHDGDVVWVRPPTLADTPAPRERLRSGVRRKAPSRMQAPTRVEGA